MAKSLFPQGKTRHLLIFLHQKEVEVVAFLFLTFYFAPQNLAHPGVGMGEAGIIKSGKTKCIILEFEIKRDFVRIIS